MIFNGKSFQSAANKNIYPFLNNLLQSEDETEIHEALNNIQILVDSGVEIKNFNGLQKILYHKNITLAHKSFDILRKISHREKNVEVKTQVWESMYPFFCDRALSTSSVAIESLKSIEVLIDYDIVGNYKTLQKALLHKNENVAQLTLDVLRRIKGVTNGPGIEKVEPISVESTTCKVEKAPQKVYHMIKEQLLEEPMQRREELQGRIIDVLKTNPSYVEDLKKIKSKYRM